MSQKYVLVAFLQSIITTPMSTVFACCHNILTMVAMQSKISMVSWVSRRRFELSMNQTGCNPSQLFTESYNQGMLPTSVGAWQVNNSAAMELICTCMRRHQFLQLCTMFLWVIITCTSLYFQFELENIWEGVQKIYKIDGCVCKKATIISNFFRNSM